jgi:hypothetical protein
MVPVKWGFPLPSIWFVLWWFGWFILAYKNCFWCLFLPMIVGLVPCCLALFLICASLCWFANSWTNTTLDMLLVFLCLSLSSFGPCASVLSLVLVACNTCWYWFAGICLLFCCLVVVCLVPYSVKNSLIGLGFDLWLLDCAKIING